MSRTHVLHTAVSKTCSFQPSFFTIISPCEHSKLSKFKEIFSNDSACAMSFHCPTLQYTSGTQCSVFRCLTAITRCLRTFITSSTTKMRSCMAFHNNSLFHFWLNQTISQIISTLCYLLLSHNWTRTNLLCSMV